MLDRCSGDTGSARLGMALGGMKRFGGTEGILWRGGGWMESWGE